MNLDIDTLDGCYTVTYLYCISIAGHNESTLRFQSIEHGGQRFPRDYQRNIYSSRTLRSTGYFHRSTLV